MILFSSRPFSVSPENGTLAENESMQITLEFNSGSVGDHTGEMVLQYDTGEKIFIMLYGVSHDANVRLEKSTIKVENTFISMSNQRIVSICNRSDVIAHFKWTGFATHQEENQQKMM